MPLKILIALAIVNKSPLKQILYPFTSSVWSWSCTMVHAWLAFKVSSSAHPAVGNATGNTCRLPRSDDSNLCPTTFFPEGRVARFDLLPKKKEGKKKIIFTDGTNAAPLRDSWITASLSFRPGLCALKCRQESHNCVLLYFLTLQSAKGHAAKKTERQAERKVSGKGRPKRSGRGDRVLTNREPEQRDRRRRTWIRSWVWLGGL